MFQPDNDLNMCYVIHFEVRCPSVHLLNGKVVSNRAPFHNGEYWYDTNITFSCNTGYTLDTSQQGSASSALCLASGNWSHFSPTCKIGNEILIGCHTFVTSERGFKSKSVFMIKKINSLSRLEAVVNNLTISTNLVTIN